RVSCGDLLVVLASREPLLLLKRRVALVEEKLIGLCGTGRHRTSPARGASAHEQRAAEEGDAERPAHHLHHGSSQTCSNVPFSHACSAASPCSRFTDGEKPKSARARAVSA